MQKDSNSWCVKWINIEDLLTLSYSPNENHIDFSHINEFSNKLVKGPYSEVNMLKKSVKSNQGEPKKTCFGWFAETCVAVVLEKLVYA